MLQQQNLANASSDLQIPTLPKTQSTTKDQSKKIGSNGSNRGLFNAAQNALGNTSSKQRIQNRSGSNATQQMAGTKKGGAGAIHPAAAAALNNSATHQKQKVPSALNGNNKQAVLNGKNSGQFIENQDLRDARDAARARHESS